jgi:hypothetical protein
MGFALNNSRVTETAMGENRSVIDAEFVEVNEATPRGFGRRTFAQEQIGVIDAIGPAARAVAGACRVTGANDAADKIESAADLADSAAAVGREIPAAINAIDEGTRPLRGAWGRLVEKMKAKGIVGERKKPFVAKRAVRQAKKKEMD